MAEFECKVYELTIEDHPNADALELAVVGDYRSIVRKGQFKTGDWGVYIPEASVLPDWLIEEMGLEGRLAGSKHNRVKAVKLRKIVSQGLVLPLSDHIPGHLYVGRPTDTGTEFHNVELGDDVTEFLGITKYEPPIPTHMAGEVFNAHGKTLGYDIENVKKYPDVLQEGEDVIMTEKLHGTWCCYGYHPDITHPVITSKGLSGKGLAFKLNDANKNNLYIRMFNKLSEVNGEDPVTMYRRRIQEDLEPFYILGEVYGKGVQDLHYGQEDINFRVFDIYVGKPGQGRYLNFSEMEQLCVEIGLKIVPILYDGPFSKEVMLEYTNGKTIAGGEHIREGVVIKPFEERRNDEIGRVILKSVSEKYLLRKGNATEFN